MPNRIELQHKGPGSRRGERGQPVGPGVSHRDISEIIKANKRAEAEARNACTTHVRTKQHRRRCSNFGKAACSAA